MRRTWEADKAKAGFAGIQWPKEYGGRGGTRAQRAIYDEEMVRHRAPMTVNGLGLTFLAPTVMVIGSDDQKRNIIKPLLHNEVIWCQGFSEPNAGSDLAAVQCRAVPDGDEYVINGQKIWTSNAMHADKMFGLFRTDNEGKKHRGITMLLVDLRNPDGSFAPGVEIRPLKQMSGASDFGEVFFTDVRVPKTSLIGEEGGGWDVAMLLLSFERGSSALPQYAAFRREVDDIIDLARTGGREQDALLRQKIASSVVELECLRYHSLHLLTRPSRARSSVRPRASPSCSGARRTRTSVSSSRTWPASATRSLVATPTTCSARSCGPARRRSGAAAPRCNATSSVNSFSVFPGRSRHVLLTH